MANDFFEWSTSPDRLVALDTARAADVNGALDQVEVGFDEVQVKTKAALKFPDGSDVAALPASGTRANKVLTFDGSGNPTVTAVSVADITSADDYAAAALAQAGVATAQAVIATTQAGIATAKAAEATASAASINPVNLATKTGAETLTNKTIALGSNTVSGTLAQFNTACTDADFQAALVSGTNIKTVNGSSLLGSGNITVAGGIPLDVGAYGIGVIMIAYNNGATVGAGVVAGGIRPVYTSLAGPWVIDTAAAVPGTWRALQYVLTTQLGMFQRIA